MIYLLLCSTKRLRCITSFFISYLGAKNGGRTSNYYWVLFLCTIFTIQKSIYCKEQLTAQLEEELYISSLSQGTHHYNNLGEHIAHWIKTRYSFVPLPFWRSMYTTNNEAKILVCNPHYQLLISNLLRTWNELCFMDVFLCFLNTNLTTDQRLHQREIYQSILNLEN